MTLGSADRTAGTTAAVGFYRCKRNAAVGYYITLGVTAVVAEDSSGTGLTVYLIDIDITVFYNRFVIFYPTDNTARVTGICTFYKVRRYVTVIDVAVTVMPAYKSSGMFAYGVYFRSENITIVYGDRSVSAETAQQAAYMVGVAACHGNFRACGRSADRAVIKSHAVGFGIADKTAEVFSAARRNISGI